MRVNAYDWSDATLLLFTAVSGGSNNTVRFNGNSQLEYSAAYWPSVNTTNWRVDFSNGLALGPGVTEGPGGGGLYSDLMVLYVPVGFGLGMSFWAVCVAAAISMRWVRDLASAAT
jgi:hypothetical protein